MDLVERRMLLNRKGSDSVKEWIKIFDETITVAESTKEIKRPLLQSCEGMTEIYALLSITDNEDETNKTGNDNGSLFIGCMGVSYGRLCDMSNYCNVIVHSTNVNDKLTFFEVASVANSLLFNVTPVKSGFFECNIISSDYDNLIISTFSRPYKGTINAKVFAR